MLSWGHITTWTKGTAYQDGTFEPVEEMELKGWTGAGPWEINCSKEGKLHPVDQR